MATATIPNTFTNGTNADANLVNANFSYLSSWLNTNAIQPSVANFSVFPTLPSSAPTSDYQAVHKNYVDLFMPAGIITQYVGTAAPSGWRLCDGTLYNGADATYARLWAALGTTYGGSGINSFQVPDLKGRVPVGYGAGAGFTARSLNDKGGFETHTLNVNELASHQHAIDHNHAAFTSDNDYPNHDHGYTVAAIGSNPMINAADTSTAYAYATTAAITSENRQPHAHNIDVPNHVGYSGGIGSGVTLPHNNMQPFVVVSYIIKL